MDLHFKSKYIAKVFCLLGLFLSEKSVLFFFPGNRETQIRDLKLLCVEELQIACELVPE